MSFQVENARFPVFIEQGHPGPDMLFNLFKGNSRRKWHFRDTAGCS